MSARTRPFEVDKRLSNYTVLVSDSRREVPEETIYIQTRDDVVPGRVVGEKGGKAVVELLVSELDSYSEVV
jgi:hypothetical protein